MLMPKYGNDLAFFLRLRTSDITGYNFNCSLMRSAALNAQRFSRRIRANTISPLIEARPATVRKISDAARCLGEGLSG